MPTIYPVARRALVTVALGAAAALAATTPAAADPFGLDTQSTSVDGVGAIPDGFNHTYCFAGSGWTTTRQNIVDGRMANLDSQTDYFDTSRGTACDELTDIRFEINTSITSRGNSLCTSWDTPTICEQFRVRLNPDRLVDTHNWVKTACHEIGHTVGLAHGTNQSTFWNDCMYSGTAPAGTQYERYNQHHIDHANSRTPASS